MLELVDRYFRSPIELQPPGDQVGALLALLLESAEAGGMPNQRAIDLHQDLLGYVCGEGRSDRKANLTVTQVLEAWARPLLRVRAARENNQEEKEP